MNDSGMDSDLWYHECFLDSDTVVIILIVDMFPRFPKKYIHHYPSLTIINHY